MRSSSAFSISFQQVMWPPAHPVFTPPLPASCCPCSTQPFIVPSFLQNGPGGLAVNASGDVTKYTAEVQFGTMQYSGEATVTAKLLCVCRDKGG